MASDFDVVESMDSRDDVEYCRSLVEKKGLEFLVLDQTRPDIGMPVARVIVPGLRHFWARFAPRAVVRSPRTHGVAQECPRRKRSESRTCYRMRHGYGH